MQFQRLGFPKIIQFRSTNFTVYDKCQNVLDQLEIQMLMKWPCYYLATALK